MSSIASERAAFDQRRAWVVFQLECNPTFPENMIFSLINGEGDGAIGASVTAPIAVAWL